MWCWTRYYLSLSRNQASQQPFFLNPDPSRVALHQLLQKIYSMYSRIHPSVYIHHHQKHQNRGSCEVVSDLTMWLVVMSQTWERYHCLVDTLWKREQAKDRTDSIDMLDCWIAMVRCILCNDNSTFKSFLFFLCFVFTVRPICILLYIWVCNRTDRTVGWSSDCQNLLSFINKEGFATILRHIRTETLSSRASRQLRGGNYSPFQNSHASQV